MILRQYVTAGDGLFALAPACCTRAVASPRRWAGRTGQSGRRRGRVHRWAGRGGAARPEAPTTEFCGARGPPPCGPPSTAPLGPGDLRKCWLERDLQPSGGGTTYETAASSIETNTRSYRWGIRLRGLPRPVDWPPWPSFRGPWSGRPPIPLGLLLRHFHRRGPRPGAGHGAELSRRAVQDSPSNTQNSLPSGSASKCQPIWSSRARKSVAPAETSASGSADTTSQ
jgi:hypothetical protein